MTWKIGLIQWIVLVHVREACLGNISLAKAWYATAGLEN
jgi:hypothetical protein